MGPFGQLRNEPVFIRRQALKTGLKPAGKIGAPAGVAGLTHDGKSVGADEIKDQFLLFQFNDASNGPGILESSAVTPKKKGSDQSPDMLVKIQMTSFQMARGEVTPDTRATMRIDLGKDENSNSSLDTLFWSIAAGLDLYNQAKKQPVEPKELRVDMDKAFSRRPVEIPGGLARMSFEVVKHKEPEWWQKIFSFLSSGTGKALTSAVGFPAITSQAVEFVDQLINRLMNTDKPEVLFRSRPLTLALSERAQVDFSGGIPGVRVGVLNPGFALLARGRDYKTVKDLNPSYFAAYGKLFPADVTPEQFLGNGYKDPFADITYAVFKVGSSETRLNPALDYSGS